MFGKCETDDLYHEHYVVLVIFTIAHGIDNTMKLPETRVHAVASYREIEVLVSLPK